MVAKFLDLNKPWSCKYGRKKEELNFLCTIALKNKAVALTFESQKFCFDGNVRSNFSSPYSSYIY